MSAREAGLAALKAGDPENAIRQLQSAVQEVPSDSQAWAALGVALCQAKRPEDGVRALDRAISIAPTQASFHYNLGRAYEMQSKTAEALRAYRRTQELDPGHQQSAAAVQRLSAAATAPAPAVAAPKAAAPVAPPAPAPAAAAPPPPPPAAPAASGLGEFSLGAAPPAPAAPFAAAAPAAPAAPAWGAAPPPPPAGPWATPAPPPPPPAAPGYGSQGYQGYGPQAYAPPAAPSYPPPPPMSSAPVQSGGGGKPLAAVGGIFGAILVVGLIGLRVAGRMGGLPSFGGPNLSSYAPGQVVSAQDVTITLPKGVPTAQQKMRSGTPLYESQGRSAEFVFGAIPLPAEVVAQGSSAIFSRFESGMVSSQKGGKVKSSQTIQVKGYPASEIRFETKSGFRTEHGLMRIIIADDRLVMVAFGSANESDINKPAVSGFFDSIQIQKHQVSTPMPQGSPSIGSGGGGSGGPSIGIRRVEIPEPPRVTVPDPPRYEPPSMPSGPSFGPSGPSSPSYGPYGPGGPPGPPGGFGGGPGGYPGRPGF